MSTGPPYLPTTAGYGGRPSTGVDVPVSAAFIAVFLALGVVHLSLFHRNWARGHFFVFSTLTFGFCLSRIVALCLRIVLARRPRDVPVAISASVLVAAGAVLLFVINLNYTQRLLRAYHTRLVGNKLFDGAFLAYYVSIALVLVMAITTTVQSFYTLNTRTLKIGSNIRRFALIYFIIFAFAPIPLLLLALLVPASSPRRNLGKMGNLRGKALIVLFVSGVLTLSTALRAATSFMPRQPTDPGWFNNRASFYAFTPMLEVIVVATYLVARVDQKFYVQGKWGQKWEAWSQGRTVEQKAYTW